MEDFIELILYISGLLLLLSVSFITYFIASLFHIHSRYDHLPGPKRSSFFFGNAKEFRENSRSSQNSQEGMSPQNKLKPLPAELFIQWADLYGDTYVIFIINRALVVTQSPEVIKNILVHGDQHNFVKTELNALKKVMGYRFCGEGLVTVMDHDVWYLRRKALDPAFHRKQLLKSIDAFNTSGDKLTEHLQQLAESGETFLLTDLIKKATLDVIIKVMFSVDSDNFDSPLHVEASKFLEESYASIQAHIEAFWPEVNPLLWNMRRRAKKLLESFRQIAADIINERLTQIDAGYIVPEDLLTTMINAYKDPSTGYTFEILVDEFVTMIIAGMDATANALSFVFMELGRRPDLWKRLVAEVDEIVGNKIHISNDDITRLPFTHQLIKESLRLYPPANLMLREIRKETELDGLVIPANTVVVILTMGINRHKKYVDNPLFYDPDRFNPEATQRVPTYSYIPFSLGSRNCIGQVFAQMEMKVMLAKFVQNFKHELDSSETFDVDQKGTLCPLNRLKGTVIVRH